MKLAALIEYDGSRYHGWQRQPGKNTVQGCLEMALSKVAAEPVTVVCAGRTDAGVHASCQVVHFVTRATRTMRAWLLGVNTELPADIACLSVQEVTINFDARRSALWRRYRYYLINSMVRPALYYKQLAWHPVALAIEPMQIAAQNWLGEHDFSSFRAANCQSKTPFRNVNNIEISRFGDKIIFDIIANAFLHHMVRNMVGTLIKIGAGKRPPSWAAEVLAARDRKQAGVTASPAGLYLVAVGYPDEYNLDFSGRMPW